MKRSALVLIAILIPVLLQAQTVNFAWDPINDAGVTGFKLYQSKQSGVYTSIAATFTPGTATTGSIPKPTTYGRYYFAMTAFAVDTTVTPNVTVESAFSNEVSLVLKPNPPHLVSATLVAVIKAPVKAIKWALGIRPKGNLRITNS